MLQPGAGSGGCLGGLGPYRRQRQQGQEGQPQQAQQQSLGSRESVRILVLGDERVGKSSLVSAFVSQCFPEKVCQSVSACCCWCCCRRLIWWRVGMVFMPAWTSQPLTQTPTPHSQSINQVPSVLTPVQIPASESPDNVATLIVDTAADAPPEHLVARIKVSACVGVLVYGPLDAFLMRGSIVDHHPTSPIQQTTPTTISGGRRHRPRLRRVEGRDVRPPLLPLAPPHRAHAGHPAPAVSVAGEGGGDRQRRGRGGGGALPQAGGAGGEQGPSVRPPDCLAVGRSV